jgi:hypothetical protein
VTAWLRRHRVLAAFVGGACLTLLVLAAAGYWVLSDQRRSARALAATLSRSLAREVRIDRVTDLTPDRVVLRGVALPNSGGWPATIVAERVEVAGPLLAAARGDAAPVRVTVASPTVQMPAGGGGGDLAGALPAILDALRSLLTNPVLLDLAVTGGRMRGGGGGAEFELNLLKGDKQAKGTLTVRDDAGSPPLVLGIEGKLDGATARVAVSGQGPLASVAAWLPPAAAATLRERALDLRLDADVGEADAVARVRLAIADGLDAAGTVALKTGSVEATFPKTTVDLGLVAAAAGLGWQPTGRAEISDLSATWKTDGGRLPTLRAVVRVPALGVPAAAGADMALDRLEATVALDGAAADPVLAGEARAARLRTPRLDGAPVEITYQVGLDRQWAVSRIEVASLRAGAEGARLQGNARFDVKAGLLDAQLEGDDVEAEGLVRRLLPGWLDSSDLLRVTGLRLTATGLDPRSLQRGSTRLEARGFRLTRPRGQLSGGRLSAQTEFGDAGAKTEVAAERVASTLAMLPGDISRVGGTAELARGPDGGFRPARAVLTARDARGQEMLAATLTPGDQPDRYRLSARAPALERLAGLWPDVSRTLKGTARLDVELSEGFAAADGRLALSVPEGELREGKISLRDLQADVPIRRGGPAASEPPWGKLTAGELIAYGVVVNDLTTPARVWRDRLMLSQLSHALYSGHGEGWTEVEVSGGPAARGKLTGARVRIEEFMSAYGVRGGTMTGLLRYDVEYQYRDGRLSLNGRFEVPEGGTVNIQLLDRLLGHAEADPTGVVRRALENLRAFDYKDATAEARSKGDDLVVSLALRGRERFLVFPPRVKEINIRNMPLSFLARQFPGS